MRTKSHGQPNPGFSTSMTHFDDLHACSVHSWLPRYQKITLKTRIIPLPKDFIAYLKEDGIRLPLNECGEAYEFYRRSPNDDDDDSDDDNDDNNDNNDSDHDIDDHRENPNSSPRSPRNMDSSTDTEDEASSEDRCFPDVDRAISSAVSELDGFIFPRLNWSSPKDAAWISPLGSLKCACPGDIYLLLKSSDFIQHDLILAEQMDELPLHLVLRKWYDIQPSMEFRCFVSKKKLLAISQRDAENPYEHLRSQQESIFRSIQEFWRKHIESTFSLEDCKNNQGRKNR